MAMKNVDEKLKKKIRKCMENLPLTLNTHFGDPFQPDQWENTLEKLKYLKAQNYQGKLKSPQDGSLPMNRLTNYMRFIRICGLSVESPV